MATKRILLTRLWDGHPAGTIVEEQDFTVDSMIRKGYGTLCKEPRPKPSAAGRGRDGRGPAAEVADAPGPTEAAVAAPQITPKPGPSRASKPDEKEQ